MHEVSHHLDDFLKFENQFFDWGRLFLRHVTYFVVKGLYIKINLLLTAKFWVSLHVDNELWYVLQYFRRNPKICVFM